MLTLQVEGKEFFDEKTKQFIDVPDIKVDLEHSLVSLSKWEQIWEIPFLNSSTKTDEQIKSYIQCMILDSSVPKSVVYAFTPAQYDEINEYISAKGTATTFSNQPPSRNSGEFVTSELIYYWLVALQIPFQPVENWHLNRLLTLVKVVNLKNTPAKKMSKSDIRSRHRAINAARRAKYGTNG